MRSALTADALAPDAISFSSAIFGAAKARKHDRLLRDMRHRNAQPVASGYAAALAACTRDGAGAARAAALVDAAAACGVALDSTRAPRAPPSPRSL